jgi:hypothetical protein
MVIKYSPAVSTADANFNARTPALSVQVAVLPSGVILMYTLSDVASSGKANKMSKSNFTVTLGKGRVTLAGFVRRPEKITF